MRMRIFLPCLLILVVIVALFYSYRIQASTLVVTVYLDLSVGRESNSLPGFGWILGQNTSISLIKWPQSALEKVDVNPKYAFNETRITPVQFAVSFLLDKINKTILTPNLTTIGGYSAVASSTFTNIGQGTYNLTIAVYIPSFERDQQRLQEFITIP